MCGESRQTCYCHQSTPLQAQAQGSLCVTTFLGQSCEPASPGGESRQDSLPSLVSEALRATIRGDRGDRGDNALPTRPIVDVYAVVCCNVLEIQAHRYRNCLVTSKHTSYKGNGPYNNMCIGVGR